MIRTNLLYPAGCYGEFFFRMLNLKETTESLSYSANFNPINTEEYNGNHHIMSEKDINGHVTKITYTDDDIDLINRNKWTKVQGHLDEQSIKTFPNNSNRNLYTMAIYKCDLLDKTNHFKSIEKNSNLEVKFKWFLQSMEQWLINFGNIFKVLSIQINENKIKEYYNIFTRSQQEILEQHSQSNDLIAKSNQLGKMYFDRHGNEYNELHFDKLCKELGGRHE